MKKILFVISICFSNILFAEVLIPLSVIEEYNVGVTYYPINSLNYSNYFLLGTFYENWNGVDNYYIAEYSISKENKFQHKIFIHGYNSSNILKTDNQGNIIGDYGVGYNIIGYSFAHMINEKMGYLCNIKIKNDYIDNNQYYNMVFDLGVTRKTEYLNFYAGFFSLSNIEFKENINGFIGITYDGIKNITVTYVSTMGFDKIYNYIISANIKYFNTIMFNTELEKKNNVYVYSINTMLYWKTYKIMIPVKTYLFDSNILSFGMGVIFIKTL